MTDTQTSPRRRGRPPSGTSAQPSSVQALDRALGLLELLSEEDGMTLSEVAKSAGMAPSTAHRLLSTLQGRGFVELDTENNHWLVGVRAFQVGYAFVRNRKLVDLGRAIMRELMEASGETVNLGIEDDGDVVFISQVESHAPMRAFFRTGRRGPIHASGIGKAVLSTYEEDRVRQIMSAKDMEPLTAKTLRGVDELLADLAEIRRRGWSVDDEEQSLGMRCIAAPVFDEWGDAIAGISVSGPTVRIPDTRLGEVGPMVREAADEISRSIGGVIPAVA